jgi:predicted ATPase/tRNA A-37 threonylcarbamoyl transferase component Bud32
MQADFHLTLEELATLGYMDLSLISETENFQIYRANTNGGECVFVKSPVSNRYTPQLVAQLEHEFQVAGDLNPEYVLRPVKTEVIADHKVLILEACACPPLNELLTQPLEIESFLTLAVGIATTLCKVHQHGLIHKALRPENILAQVTGEVKLTGFGVATKLRREHPSTIPQELNINALAYLAPEQTGWMNRFVDKRSDLYALGVVFYQMLTGRLPFTASDPMAWVHCHTALEPTPPQEYQNIIPALLSELVMKLLAKTAEARYQTTEGLKADLERCQNEKRIHRSIKSFELGRSDIPNNLMIPEKLYGRDREVTILLDAVDRVADCGNTELLLVSGFSGIGKSVLVNELHKMLVSPHLLFAQGKFDRNKRDIPYLALTQVLASLVAQILGKKEEEIAQWRDQLNVALESNGRLVTDLVPDLIALIGEQPPVAELPPQDAQNRFHHIMQRLIDVFAQPKTPLVVFLDDLQWLDTPTQALLAYLFTQPTVNHLLVLGAYRHNEVDRTHPLMRTVEVVRHSNIKVSEIGLTSLTSDDVCHLVADSLYCEVQRARPLARLVHEKTRGNPFFVIQFLNTLEDEQLLVFQPDTHRWTWKLEQIHAKNFTNNAVDLMLRKIGNLSAITQEGLKQFACLGTSADIKTLASACEQSEAALHSAFWDALQAGLVLRHKDIYQFLHDRVQEAAYALIPETSKQSLHLKIGRLLLAQYAQKAQPERVFDIVDQLNRGIDLVTSSREKKTLRQLNTLAGKQALDVLAYACARRYLEHALALLPQDPWNQCHAESFTLFLHLLECEYLMGNLKRADALLALILKKALTRLDLIRTYCLCLRLYRILERFDQAFEVALKALSLFHITLPEKREDWVKTTEAEHQHVINNLHARQISDLVHIPVASDDETRSLIELFADVGALIYLLRPEIYPYFTAKAVNICLQKGQHGDASPFIYSSYALALAADIRNITTAQQFSELAVELSQKIPTAGPVRGKILSHHAVTIMIWRHHFAECLPVLRQAFYACIDFGDLDYGAYAIKHAPWLHLESGESLDQLVAETQRYITFAEKSKKDTLYHIERLHQQFLLALQGKTESLTNFSDTTFDERRSVGVIEQVGSQMEMAFYCISKQMAAFLAGQYEEALTWVGRAASRLVCISGCANEPAHYLYHALTLSALYGKAPADQKRHSLQMMIQIKERLKRWADACPENFVNR